MNEGASKMATTILGKRPLANVIVFAILLFGCASACPAQQANFGASPGNTLLLPEISLDAKPAAATAFSTNAFADAPPAPPPRYNWNEYRWDLETSITFFRFQSSVYYASMIGFKSGVAYHLDNWVALEAGVTTGFAPEVFINEHVKYLDYMGGVRIGPQRDRISPWAHVMVGGAHVLPQTAAGGQNAFAMRAGIGADYRFNAVFSWRVELDYVRTQFFNSSQNNFQAATGAVFHF
jgi:hypothetical protein